MGKLDDAARVREHFAFFDTDHNGLIDFDEFSRLLTVLAPDATKKQAAEGFGLVDENGDGYIDLPEFTRWWKTGWWEY